MKAKLLARVARRRGIWLERGTVIHPGRNQKTFPSGKKDSLSENEA